MCTVSIVPRDAGFRLLCNRDELLTRPPAEHPAVHPLHGATAIWPTDPQGGGTWIAVNDAGLAFALLNRRPRLMADLPVSRGTIIPALATAGSLLVAVRRALRLPPASYQNFTLLVVDRYSYAAVSNSGGRLWLEEPRPLNAPLMFTSSSLGDQIAFTPRQALFTSLVIGGSDPLADQAMFHRHRWPSRPEISVEMVREDAATVSRTAVEVRGRSMAMGYTPLPR